MLFFITNIYTSCSQGLLAYRSCFQTQLQGLCLWEVQPTSARMGSPLCLSFSKQLLRACRESAVGLSCPRGVKETHRCSFQWDEVPLLGEHTAECQGRSGGGGKPSQGSDMWLREEGKQAPQASEDKGMWRTKRWPELGSWEHMWKHEPRLGVGHASPLALLS